MRAKELLDAYCQKHQVLKSWKEQKAKKNFDEMANHFSYFDMEELADIASDEIFIARKQENVKVIRRMLKKPTRQELAEIVNILVEDELSHARKEAK